MYYVVEIEYIGRYWDEHLNDHTFDIQTDPPRDISPPYPVITDGWLGTTNDWWRYAHGAHDTLDAARRTLEQVANGAYRGPVDLTGTFLEGSSIVERYLDGLRPLMTPQESAELAALENDRITADFTEQDLKELTEEVAAEILDETDSVPDEDAIYHTYVEWRDELIEAAKEDAE